MAQVNILSGVYTNSAADFRVSYPKNLYPIPMVSGASTGNLRPAEGIIEFGTGPGIDRGAINWKGVCYRVMGTKLVSISSTGVTTTLGDVGAGGQCTLDYSFDRLAIASGGNLYYWDGTLTQVTDVDLGLVVDLVWVDGYFMTTDGENLVVTELNDPFAVNPLKYGSSEVDPDPIQGLVKLRDEVYAYNRYTIEVFQNVGGDLFPFQRVPGAMVERGALGTHCTAVYLDNIAFLGGGRNEPPAVWLASNGSSINISTREIDLVLKEYTEVQLSNAVVETRVTNAQKLLYIHLPDRTLVYDGAASQVFGQPTWAILSTSIVGNGIYRARNFIWCYDRWLSGDPTSVSHGYLSDTISSHYGETIGFECTTAIIYNGGAGAIFLELELVCLTGRVDIGVNPTIWASYTIDGLTWSQEKPRTLGTIGQTSKRIVWYQQGFMRNWRGQKFRWTSESLLTVARLEMKLEPLNG